MSSQRAAERDLDLPLPSRLPLSAASALRRAAALPLRICEVVLVFNRAAPRDFFVPRGLLEARRFLAAGMAFLY